MTHETYWNTTSDALLAAILAPAVRTFVQNHSVSDLAQVAGPEFADIATSSERTMAAIIDVMLSRLESPSHDYSVAIDVGAPHARAFRELSRLASEQRVSLVDAAASAAP